MALITDPDQLNIGVEVVYDTASNPPTIQLLEAGNLSADGVTEKAIYSNTMEDYKDTASLISQDFPFVPITDEFFEIGIDPSGNPSGFTWADATTRNLIRRGGWLQRDSSGNKTEHWAGIAILNAQSDDQCYYDIGAGPVDFVYQGNTQEAVQVQSDPNGDGNFTDGFDRSANITVFNRQQGQLYSSASSSASGEANILAPKLFSFSLGTGTDLNIVESDSNIDANAPFTGMSITYFATPQSRTIGASSFDFGIIIDGNNGTLEQIYSYVQRQLRQSGDIDAGAGTVIGRTADVLLQFVGGVGDGSGSLETLNATNPAGGGTGVFIDNVQPTDINRVSFRDNTAPSSTVSFPRVANLILEPNAVAQADPLTEYFVFFTDPDGVTNNNEFNTPGATLVPLNGGGDMAGLVSGQGQIVLPYDFDGDTTGGRTGGQPVPVTIVAVGASSGGAQYFRTVSTIVFPSVTVALSNQVDRQFENQA